MQPKNDNVSIPDFVPPFGYTGNHNGKTPPPPPTPNMMPQPPQPAKPKQN